MLSHRDPGEVWYQMWVFDTPAALLGSKAWIAARQ